MPVKVLKRGKSWCVVEAKSGSTHGHKGRCHGSKMMAGRQARAINASLHRQGKI